MNKLKYLYLLSKIKIFGDVESGNPLKFLIVNGLKRKLWKSQHPKKMFECIKIKFNLEEYPENITNTLFCELVWYSTFDNLTSDTLVTPQDWPGPRCRIQLAVSAGSGYIAPAPASTTRTGVSAPSSDNTRLGLRTRARIMCLLGIPRFYRYFTWLSLFGQ